MSKFTFNTRHTPGPYWAERADDYDRQNGRLHLSRIVLAPPMQYGGEPEPVAYVDTEGDVAMVLAGPYMLAQLIRAEQELASYERGTGYPGLAALCRDIRQTILKATEG